MNTLEVELKALGKKPIRVMSSRWGWVGNTTADHLLNLLRWGHFPLNDPVIWKGNTLCTFHKNALGNAAADEALLEIGKQSSSDDRQGGGA